MNSFKKEYIYILIQIALLFSGYFLNVYLVEKKETESGMLRNENGLLSPILSRDKEVKSKTKEIPTVYLNNFKNQIFIHLIHLIELIYCSN